MGRDQKLHPGGNCGRTQREFDRAIMKRLAPIANVHKVIWEKQLLRVAVRQQGASDQPLLLQVLDDCAGALLQELMQRRARAKAERFDNCQRAAVDRNTIGKRSTKSRDCNSCGTFGKRVFRAMSSALSSSAG